MTVQTRQERFEHLVALVYVPLQRYAARRIDAADVDDVVSDALLVAWRRLEDVPEGAELPWCYGVARRCLANRRRSAQRREQLLVRLAEQPAATELDPRTAEAVEVALAALAETDREVVQLWAWEALAPAQIAVVLGVSANAVSIRLFRAKRKMRSALAHLPDGTGKTWAAAGHDGHDSRKETR